LNRPSRLAEFVADQEVQLVELPQQPIELILLLRFFQAIDQRRGGEEPHVLALPTGGQAQCDPRSVLPVPEPPNRQQFCRRSIQPPRANSSTLGLERPGAALKPHLDHREAGLQYAGGETARQ
jgi:hypothetical protein